MPERSKESHTSPENRLEEAVSNVDNFFVPDSWQEMLILHENHHIPIVKELHKSLSARAQVTMINTEDIEVRWSQSEESYITDCIREVDGVINFYTFKFRAHQKAQERQSYLHNLLKTGVVSVDTYRLFKDVDYDTFESVFSVSPQVIDELNRSLIETSVGKNQMKVTTPEGTQITAELQTDKYPWINENGFAEDDYELPPGEIATTSSKVNGTLVVGGVMFGTIPIGRKYGIPAEPAIIKVENSRVVSIHSRNKELERDLELCLFFDSGTSQVGEIAIGTGLGVKKITGLNYAHEERAPGFHIGFGATVDPTLERPSNQHLDFIFPQATISFDEEVVMSNGRFTLCQDALPS